MSVSSYEEVVGLVRREVQARGRVQGSRLAQRVRDETPAFSAKEAGFRSFREFLAQFVPELLVVERAGADVVYAFSDDAPPASLAAEEPDLWRVWTSPKSRYVLVILGETLSAGRRDAVPTGSLMLPPCDVAFHRGIAKAFLDGGYAPELTARLADAVADPGYGWWMKWQRVLQHHPESKDWQIFRHDRFSKEFQRALTEGGVAECDRSTLQAALEESRQTPRGRRTEDRLAVQPEPRPERQQAQQQEAQPSSFRAFVLAVVSQMTDDELRKLRLPAGASYQAKLSER